MSRVRPYVHIPYDLFDRFLPFFRQEKLNPEIYFGSRSFGTITKSDLLGLKKKLDYPHELTIHAPFMDLSPGAVDPKVREVTLQRFFDTLDIGEILRARVIVFHSGYDKWKYNNRVDIWLEGSLQTWRPVNERAAALGIKIAIENIFEDEPHHLRMLADAMSSGNFGICFDTGHFNLFSRVPLVEWLSVVKPCLKELHLHDNSRRGDEHLPLGEGTFDFETLFEEVRGIDCVYTIEAHSVENAKKSLARLDGYLP
ncbi:MAG: sugar phosphate isomerase/epimerase [Nitrospiraceae bacterium]|nr:MAG: sugar phosphate isomerase/epimerase [Nitrospiraceae bacterium]